MNHLKKILLGTAILFAGCSTNKVERNVTMVIAADTHFDHLPETDQYYHILAMNRLKDSLQMQHQDLDGVILAGDMIDKLASGVLELFKTRYEKGEGEKQIHTWVYPGFGNHDLDAIRLSISEDSLYQRKIMLNYMDTVLKEMKETGKILNYDPSSRCYSWNVQDVHFIQGQRVANDSSYCKSNLTWLKEDLKKYASKGNPVVYVQHYGFDKWALGWWSEETRQQLFNIFEPYNLVAFLVGHTHEASVQKYGGFPIYQVNNAWKDGDGKGSFALLQITDQNVKISTCVCQDGKGHYNLEKPTIERELK
jgi:cytolysin (calcineurin-like family phosphatase)